MNIPEALTPLRMEIDRIDSQLLPLLEQRMEIVRSVAKIKQENNLPIFDEVREQQVIDRALANTREAYRGQISLLLRTIMALSRGQQRIALSMAEEPLLPPAREPKRENVKCVYQGVPGAWSEIALRQAFPGVSHENNVSYGNVDYFEDVFLAVKEGRADYGVVALENSRTGAIGETYDLLRRHNCYITGRTTVPVRHCLLAAEGVKLSDIREVYSHPQGFRQCAYFLRGRAWEQIDCRNTAVAAEKAASDPDKRTAAIGSRRAGELNGLSVLSADIMDSAENKTTFIIIASEPEYTPEDRYVSVTFSTVHRSGALCESLLPFMAHGINLVRIESRPGFAGSYRFFAELEGNILEENMRCALRQAAMACEYFEITGCYSNRGGHSAL